MGTTQHPASHFSTDPPKCFAHPSSRARAQLPLLATSPPPPSAWLRAPPALEPQGLLVPLAVTPSPSARLPAKSSTSAKKRRPSFSQSRTSSSSKGSTWRIWTSTSTTSLLSLSAPARASKSERVAGAPDEYRGPTHTSCYTCYDKQ